jgi:hypothetical protein
MAEKRVARGIWQTPTGWRVHVYKVMPAQSKRLPKAITARRRRRGFA